jgi:predicted dehydrogenase
MKGKNLRAVVIGAGWAGEGHTIALRDANVEVVAMCGRSPEPTQARAAQLNISEVRFDWRKALIEFQPDIVTIATPGNVHSEIVLAASEMGIHILCDKPLGIDAKEAKNMLQTVEQAGVKHAYASTHQYDPCFQYAHQLLRDGIIGQMWQAEYISHGFLQLTPYSWIHQLSMGGGFLNNVFTHHLGEVLRVTGGKVHGVTGKVTGHGGLVPVGKPVHDSREYFSRKENKQDKIIEWKETDADFALTALVQIVMTDGNQAFVLFQGSVLSIGNYSSYIALYGTKGTLKINFGDPNKILLATTEFPEWKEMPIPRNVLDRLPAAVDIFQRYWNQLCREFVDDIRGKGYAGYPTFFDGWVANEVIDGIRSGGEWRTIPNNPYIRVNS